jgi:hypothetical protein
LGVGDTERCCAIQQKADDQEMPRENSDRAVSEVNGIDISGEPLSGSLGRQTGWTSVGRASVTPDVLHASVGSSEAWDGRLARFGRIDEWH